MRGIIENLSRFLVQWYAKLKNWHAGTLQVNHARVRWHVNCDGMQARWRIDHLGTQAHLARDLENFDFNILFANKRNWKI